MNNNTEEKKILFYVKVVEVVDESDGGETTFDDDDDDILTKTVFYLYSDNMEEFKTISHGTLKAETYPITDVVGDIFRRRHTSPYVLKSIMNMVSFPVFFSTIENARQWLKQNSQKKLWKNRFQEIPNDNYVQLHEVIPIDQFNEWFED